LEEIVAPVGSGCQKCGVRCCECLCDARDERQWQKFTLKMKAARSSKTLVPYYITTWFQNLKDYSLNGKKYNFIMKIEGKGTKNCAVCSSHKINSDWRETDDSL
jgi:CRISPR/Cas system-associated endonuclease Cas3-HD